MVDGRRVLEHHEVQPSASPFPAGADTPLAAYDTGLDGQASDLKWWNDLPISWSLVPASPRSSVLKMPPPTRVVW